MNSIRSSHCLQCLCLGLCLIAGCAKKTPTGTNAGTQQAPFEGTAGRNVVLQLPMDNANKLILTKIGYAYRLAMAGSDKPPKNMEELGVTPKDLKTNRDMQEREVVVLYGVDNRKLDNAADYALAWEKTPDNNNGRMVLMADYVTVKYVSTAEFEAMKKAK